jgi:hypothetical protein
MRSAYEATFAGRPLVISDVSAARSYFPHALRTHNDGASIAHALSDIRDDYEHWLLEAAFGRDTQSTRVDTQLKALRRVLEVDLRMVQR